MKQKIACGCVMLSVCGAAPAWAQSWVAGPARPQASAGMSGALLPSGALWTVGGDGGGSTTENAYILEGGAWRAAAELSVSRTAASATVLPSGEVLVVGGRVESGGVGSPLVSTSAVELYDSMQDLVSAVAPLSAARDEHTATRLLDGRVMIIGGRTRTVVGGAPVDAVLASTLFFDPVTRAWSPGPSLQTGRRSHVTLRLASGQLLVISGRDAGGSTVSTVELFNPATNMFSLANQNFGLIDVSGTLRNDGLARLVRVNGNIRGFDTRTFMAQVLSGLSHLAGDAGVALTWDDGVVFAGGRVPAGPVGGALLSATDVLTPVGGSLMPRAEPLVARLPSGEVVVSGGRDAAGASLTDTTLFLPAAPGALESLSVPPMPRPSVGHRAVLLSDGRILVVGGDAVLYALYDRTAGVWSSPPLPTGITLQPAVATLAGGKVLAVGGTNGAASAGVLLFDPATTSWATLPPMSLARVGHTATRLDSGEVLVVGGGPQVGEVFDPETEQWRNTPALGARREGHTATRLLDGRVLVVGGLASGQALASAEVYTPATGAWTTVGSLVAARSLHAAVLLPSGEVMVSGGTRAGVSLDSVEVWSPTTGTWRAGPALTVPRAGHVMQVMPDDAVLVVGGLGAGYSFSQVAERLGASRRGWALIATPSSIVRGGGLAGVFEPDGRYWAAGGFGAVGQTGPRDLVERFAVRSVSAPITLTVPSRASASAPMALTGTALIAATEAHSGRTTAIAADLPTARLYTSEGAFAQVLRPRAVSSVGLTVDLGAQPPGIYQALVTTAGRSAGGLVRVGNRLPVARALSLTTAEDTPLALTLTGGDRDGDTLSFVVTASPQRGQLSGTPPRLTYTPAADVFGTDTFRYRANDGLASGAEVTVTIVVTAVNDSPRGGDDSYSTAEDTPLVVPAASGLLANDRDVDSATLRVVVASLRGPANGAVTVQADGSFLYVPAANASGPDSFTYHVSDGQTESDDVTVSVLVTPVEDAPETRADRYTAEEDQVLVVSEGDGVLSNDLDVDSAVLTATLTEAPARGLLVLEPSGAFVYTPEPDDFGTLTFRYVALDGALRSRTATVSLELRGVADAPVAVGDEYAVPEAGTLEVPEDAGVLLNDRDADREPLTASLVRDVEHGVLELRADGSLRYVADPGFEGDDSFQYEARDRVSRSRPVTVRLRVRPDRPEALADTYEGEEDVALVVTATRGVLANDQGAVAQAELLQPPASGTLELRPDGSFVLTPAADFAGELTFVYRARDGVLESAPATVTVRFGAVNDPPPVPRPLLPADGASVESAAVAFGWQSVRDVDGDVVLYRVRLIGPDGPRAPVDTAEAFWAPPAEQALGPGEYRWSVEARDAQGASLGPSPELRFRVPEGGGGPGPGGAEPDEGGCGCSTTTKGPRVEPWLVLGMVLLFLRRRAL